MSRPLRVLVVDDDLISRRVACAMLRDVGISRPLQAADGVEALAAIRQSQEPVDLTICDLAMARMDGVELLSQLGTERPGMAVVLLSSMEPALIAAVETMALSSGLRVLGAMQKPLDRSNLRKLVEQLGARRTARFTPTATVSPAELRGALDARQIVPFFQPKIDVRTGALAGVEALARWRRADGGVVSPAAFIPVAESCDLIGEITWTMLDTAMAAQARWQHAGSEIAVSVNLTVRFLEEIAVTENVLALARKHGVDPRAITLELTESMATTDVVAVIGNLVRLRMRGFGLAIDDFGTGYASMQQLSRIPFTEIKVDRSFVNGAARQPHVRAILESSLDLGRRLGLSTIAEGVETEEDLALVKSFGCEIAQGYLFARPMDGDALLEWIANRAPASRDAAGKARGGQPAAVDALG